MKKLTLTTLTILTLILTACGASSTTPQAGPGAQDRTLPVATQLMVGTFKLEDTDQAVTAEQAKGLLPLWQVYQDLSTSDTAAQEDGGRVGRANSRDHDSRTNASHNRHEPDPAGCHVRDAGPGHGCIPTQ